MSILESINILSPKDSPFGLAYEEHAKDFGNIFYLFLLIKAQCKTKQERSVPSARKTPSPVFYLFGSGGSKVERTCTIPHGKGVLIPVMVVEVSDKERPNATVEELHKIATKDQDSVTSMYLRVDDKEYDMNYLSKL